MSGEGGVGGVGGAGGAHVGGTPGAGSGASNAVTPAKGASGVSDDAGKASMTVGGDNNLVGNTQTQTNNINNYYQSPSTDQFSTMHQMGKVGGVSSAQNAGGEMNADVIMKMMMMLMMMQMMQMMMESMGGSGGGGFSGTM